ncbi:DDB1- and CUL4-associated factor 7-like [Porphyridium purpureum]|uniref:DDB1-and CUL4-associated factor 7-like n=1 Tax=Porphyridium purpureum TaxID=35688 RepID=A0A5J4YTZ2_PORPP|nr:DDB1- and CUL4-associated factor 7-like [Porphyridium purpureum]|eukprot:POR6484..scf227_4
MCFFRHSYHVHPKNPLDSSRSVRQSVSTRNLFACAQASNNIPVFCPAAMAATNTRVLSAQAADDLYAVAWSQRPDRALRLAVGGLDAPGSLDVYDVVESASAAEALQLQLVDSVALPGVSVKCMWVPDDACQAPGLVASAGDALHVCMIPDQVTGSVGHAKVAMSLQSAEEATQEFCVPLTGLDWPEPGRIATSSVYGHVSIWDVESARLVQKIQAHDEPCYEVAFQPMTSGKSGANKFISTSRDGSVRMFDTRDLHYSMVVFEAPQKGNAMIRASWNRLNENLLCVVPRHSDQLHILDVRVPCLPVASLSTDLDAKVSQHESVAVNACSWAPSSAHHLATCDSSGTAYVFDLEALPEPVSEPILQYKWHAPLNNMAWSACRPDILNKRILAQADARRYALFVSYAIARRSELSNCFASYRGSRLDQPQKFSFISTQFSHTWTHSSNKQRLA